MYRIIRRLCILPAGWHKVIQNHARASVLTNAESKIGRFKEDKVQNNNVELLQRILNLDTSHSQQVCITRKKCDDLSTTYSRLFAYFKKYKGDDKQDRYGKSCLDDLSLWFIGVFAIYGIIISHNWFKIKEQNKCPLQLLNKDALFHILQHGIHPNHIILAVNSKKVPSLPPINGHTSSGGKWQILGEKLDKAVESFQEVSDECCGLIMNKEGMHCRRNNQYKKAFELFESASSYGHVPSLYNLGLCYEHGHGVEISFEKAAEYYKLAADKGHLKSMYNVASFHYEGKGWLADENRDVGFLYMKKAADKGLVQAQSFVALRFAESSNYPEAFKYFKMAADQKHLSSMFNVGVCLENGLGVSKDVPEAMKYYHQCGEMGHVVSQFYLGDSYQHGIRGKEKDQKGSLRWFRLAAVNGHKESESRVDLLESEMRKEEKKKNILLTNDILSFLNRTKALVEPKYSDAFLLPSMGTKWRDVNKSNFLFRDESLYT